jgi:hypothetical protein
MAKKSWQKQIDELLILSKDKKGFVLPKIYKDKELKDIIRNEIKRIEKLTAYRLYKQAERICFTDSKPASSICKHLYRESQ